MEVLPKNVRADVPRPRNCSSEQRCGSIGTFSPFFFLEKGRPENGFEVQLQFSRSHFYIPPPSRPVVPFAKWKKNGSPLFLHFTHVKQPSPSQEEEILWTLLQKSFLWHIERFFRSESEIYKSGDRGSLKDPAARYFGSLLYIMTLHSKCTYDSMGVHSFPSTYIKYACR